MEIKNSRIVAGLALDVLDDAVKALQLNNHFRTNYEWNQIVKIPENPDFYVRFYLTISPPDFWMIQEGKEPSTRLFLKGTYNVALLDAEMNPEMDNNGNPKFLIKEPANTFNASFNLEIALLRNNPEEAPSLGLKYSGLHEFDFGMKKSLEIVGFGYLVETAVEELESELDKVAKMLDGFRLDIISPLLKVIEDVYFMNNPELTPPPPGYYPVFLKLLFGENPGSRNMIAIIINYPIDTEEPELYESILPMSAELFVYVNPEIVPVLIEQIRIKAMSYISEYIATANESSLLDVKCSLSLALEKSVFKLSGKITNSHWLTGGILPFDEVKLNTEVPLRHSPGAPMIFPDTLHLTVDLDTPWVISSDTEKEMEQQIKKYIEDALKEGMQTAMFELGEALNVVKGFIEKGFPVMAYPDTFKIHDNNAMSFLIQLFILPKREDIAHASYSKMFRKFILCKTTTGRNFQISDLAKLMQDGWISMEHFQQVGGKYIRTIPDGNKNNNMKALFWKLT